MFTRINKALTLVGQRGLTCVPKAMSQIKTFVFLDLETTGLPHMEHNSTKVTEMCAVAVQANHIELGCFPRVYNKLSLCFNPNKQVNPESTNITGLSNDLLEDQTKFSREVVETLKNWLELNQKPVCFVAHNGDRFDYPILRAEIDATGNCLSDDFYCIDSLTAFRALDVPESVVKEQPKAIVPFEFDDGYDELLVELAEAYEKTTENGKRLLPEEVQRVNETTPKKQIISTQTTQHKPRNVNNNSKRNFTQQRCTKSYKLQDVFTRLTSKPPQSAHEAEGDVSMLITCAAVYGERFLAYANENARKFSEVPMMKPGKRIGT